MDMTAKIALMSALAAGSSTLSSSLSTTAGASSAAAAAAVAVSVTERTFICSDGIKLAAQHWRSNNSPCNNNNNNNNNDDQISQITSTETATNNSNNNINNKHYRILCLHGWLDNCRSFYLMAPKLIQSLTNLNVVSNISSTAEIIALDLPGHGLSSHKSSDSFQLLSDYSYYVAETIQQLQWCNNNNDNNNNNNNNDNSNGSTSDNDDEGTKTTHTTTSIQNNNNKFTLIGHSMGAGVGVMYAASFPEQISNLILLDNAGPLPRKANDISKHLRSSIERRLVGNKQLYGSSGNSSSNSDGSDGTCNDCNIVGIQGSRKPGQFRIYPSLEKAVETRIANVKLYPGNQYISKEAATELVIRGTKCCNDSCNDITKIGQVQFRHDVRLQWPSISYVTEEQLNGLYNKLNSYYIENSEYIDKKTGEKKRKKLPICLLHSKDGYPISDDIRKYILKTLKPTYYQQLDGSHHFHADPDTVDNVVRKTSEFIIKTTT